MKFLFQQVSSSWLEGEYLRNNFGIILEYTPSDGNSFMTTEDFYTILPGYSISLFRVNYGATAPYDQPCQPWGAVINSAVASNCVVGNPRFQVMLNSTQLD